MRQAGAILVAILALCYFPSILPGADFTIDTFCGSQRIVPAASNELIAPVAGKELARVTVEEKINPGELVMRRRFSSAEYCLFKGKIAQGIDEQNLYPFPLTQSFSYSRAVTTKFYNSSNKNNPDDDLPDVYFDKTNLYIKYFPTIYYYENDKWVSMTSTKVKIEQNKSKLTGDLVVTSVPKGAWIFVDGESKDAVTDTYVTGLIPGEHTVGVQLVGYQKMEKTVTVKTESVDQVNFTLVSALGALQINSKPSGARVKVKGAEKGVTPLTLRNLEPGDYGIQLEMEWFVTKSDTITIEMDETTVVELDMVPDFGSVSIHSEPNGANITLNGIDQGHAPVSIDRYRPGTYLVSARLDMYKPKDTTITVERDSELRWDAVLEPNFGTVALATVPVGCAYYVDEKRAASGLLRLTPGRHRIRLDGGGDYRSFDTLVTIDVGENIVMERQAERLTGSIKVMPIPLDAEMFIDGKSVGIGPRVIPDLVTGPHSVQAVKQGYQLTRIEVDVMSDETVTASLKLAEIPDRDGDGVEDSKDECPDDPGTTASGCSKNTQSSFGIQTDPAGATLVEESRISTTTPATIALTTGRHILSLRLKNYLDTTFSIISEPDSSRIVYSSSNVREIPVGSNESVFIKLRPTPAFLDSLAMMKRKAHKRSMLIRQIVFGAASIGFAGAGYYYNDEYDKYFSAYKAERNPALLGERWSDVEKNKRYRDIVYSCAGAALGLCTISFVF